MMIAQEPKDAGFVIWGWVSKIRGDKKDVRDQNVSIGDVTSKLRIVTIFIICDLRHHRQITRGDLSDVSLTMCWSKDFRGEQKSKNYVVNHHDLTHHELMSLLLQPFFNPKLTFHRSQHLGLSFGILSTFVKYCKYFLMKMRWSRKASEGFGN